MSMSKSDINNKQEEDLLGIYDEEDEEVMLNKYLSFRIDKRIYCIEIKYVNNIIEVQAITEIPDMPSFVKGVITLREKVIAVMDMRLRLDLSEKEYDDRTCIIILTLRDILVGLIVDTVTEVLRIPKESISKPPKFKDSDNRFVSGIGKVGEQIKIILDVERLLYEEEFETVSNLVKDESIVQ